MTTFTAATVSSPTHTGIYYSPANARTATMGRNIRLVHRDQLPALRARYKNLRRDDRVRGAVRRDDRVPPWLVRMEMTARLRTVSAETVTPTGERIVGAR